MPDDLAREANIASGEVSVGEVDQERHTIPVDRGSRVLELAHCTVDVTPFQPCPCGGPRDQRRRLLPAQPQQRVGVGPDWRSQARYPPQVGTWEAPLKNPLSAVPHDLR